MIPITMLSFWLIICSFIRQSLSADPGCDSIENTDYGSVSPAGICISFGADTPGSSATFINNDGTADAYVWTSDDCTGNVKEILFGLCSLPASVGGQNCTVYQHGQTCPIVTVKGYPSVSGGNLYDCSGEPDNTAHYIEDVCINGGTFSQIYSCATSGDGASTTVWFDDNSCNDTAATSKLVSNMTVCTAQNQIASCAVDQVPSVSVPTVLIQPGTPYTDEYDPDCQAYISFFMTPMGMCMRTDELGPQGSKIYECNADGTGRVSYYMSEDCTGSPFKTYFDVGGTAYCASDSLCTDLISTKTYKNVADCSGWYAEGLILADHCQGNGNSSSILECGSDIEYKQYDDTDTCLGTPMDTMVLAQDSCAEQGADSVIYSCAAPTVEPTTTGTDLPTVTPDTTVLIDQTTPVPDESAASITSATFIHVMFAAISLCFF